MEKDYERDSKIFKAFCDPNRLKILDILKSGEHCACKLLEILDVSQSTLSHHMKILTDSKRWKMVTLFSIKRRNTICN